MPKLKEIINILELTVPSYLKEEWDNVGLIIGDREAEIKKILVALDCTKSVVFEAINKNADLIITHHPLIFEGIKNIDFNTSMGYKIKQLINNNINLVSLHTNFDKVNGGTSDTIAKILGIYDVKNLTEEEFSLGKIGSINPMTLEEFLNKVKDNLNLKNIKYIGNNDKIINKVAVVSGAGADFLYEAKKMGADCLVTSEVKHHIGIDALENDIAIIDAGHFETENVAMKTFIDLLKDLPAEVIMSETYTHLFNYL